MIEVKVIARDLEDGRTDFVILKKNIGVISKKELVIKRAMEQALEAAIESWLKDEGGGNIVKRSLDWGSGRG